MWGVIHYDSLAEKLYVGTYASGIMLLEKKHNDWQLIKSVPGYEESVRFFQSDHKNQIWISQPGKGVDRLRIDWDTDTILEIATYDTLKGFPQNENNYVFKVSTNQKSDLVFGTMKGIYVYDETLDSMVKHPEFESTIADMETDLFIQAQGGEIWFQSLKNEQYYKGFLYLDKQNEWHIADTSFFKLKNVYAESYSFINKKVAFNTSEGVFFYDETEKSVKKVPFKSVIAGFRMNDSILYDAPGILNNNYIIEADPKSLFFQFGSLYFQDRDLLLYRYKLDGFDENWSDWTNQTQKEYTNLPPGKFSFYVECKNPYEQISEKAELHFIIDKAWYQSYWAYFLYLIILIGIVVLIVRLYTYKLKLDKIRLERIILERTHEINQQKEELRTVAENLKEANTLILDKNIALEDANLSIASRNRQITDSITYALTIQSAMLPKEKHFSQYFNQSFILYKPKDIVSGDFYWIKESDNKLLVVAADCTGHGVPGGFMSMLGMAFLSEIWQNREANSPSRMLEELRWRVKQVFENANQTYEQNNGMDLSMILYERTQKELIFAGANSSLLIIRNKSGEFEHYRGDKQPIGNYRKEVPFTEQKISVNQGDWIYMFSDGFQDQIGEKTKMRYKSNQFYQFLMQCNQLDAQSKYQAIENEFYTWKGQLNQVDDVLIIGLEI
jgi:serine phosphatase RsbU (regulator of sigma subunit)